MAGAEQAFGKFADNYEEILDQNLMSLSEQMAATPAVILQSDTDLALAFLATHPDPASNRLALQILASRTGRLMEMQGDRSRLYRDPKYNASGVFKLRAERATLLLRGMSPQYQALLRTARLPDDLQAPLDIPAVGQAIGQLAFAEDQLTWRLGSGAHDAFVIHPVSADDIVRSLDAGTAIICYSLVPRIDPWTGRAAGADYVSWTIGPASRLSVQIIGDADDVARLAHRFFTAVHRAPAERASEAEELAPLSRALFGQLLPDWRQLASAKRIVVIPDGALNLVPFAALTTDAGKPLIADVDIGYGSSLREMVRDRLLAASVQAAVLVGAPPFGEAASPTSFDFSSPLTPALSPLPGAEGEIRAIGGILGSDTRIYTGEGATEALVKSLASPAILHIATHGEYIPDGADARLDAFQLVRPQPNGLGTAGTKIANPLFHGYLAMAEYDQVRPIGEEDGILSDAEILGLNLEGTDLAVASGCSTGLGPIERGYGVFSMRTAFSLAGAKTQIVSLWTADDDATKLLMIRFYRLLLQGHSKIRAFSEVQRQFASGDHAFSDPYYWAAFTPSGDDGVLAIVAQHASLALRPPGTLPPLRPLRSPQ